MLRCRHHATRTLTTNLFSLLLYVAIDSIDELLLIREREARHLKEIDDLKQQLADAKRRNERLVRELNGRSFAMGT